MMMMMMINTTKNGRKANFHSECVDCNIPLNVCSTVCA